MSYISMSASGCVAVLRKLAISPEDWPGVAYQPYRLINVAIWRPTSTLFCRTRIATSIVDTY
jgi:hypothetical protein